MSDDLDARLAGAAASRLEAQGAGDGEAWFRARGRELAASRALEEEVRSSRAGRLLALLGERPVRRLVLRRKRRAYGGADG